MENEPARVEDLAATPGMEGEAAVSRLPHSLRALRHRNYRLYFMGQLVSMTGSWMQTTALAWVVYHATHQTKWPAYIATAQILPTFLFGLWGGVLADRWPKRTLIFITQAASLFQALALLVIVGQGVLDPWTLVGVTAVGGIIQAIDFPARLAFVIEIATREDLVNAVALNSLQFNVARVIGPALAGIVLAWGGPNLCFLVNAASYLAILWALAAMHIVPTTTKQADSGGFRVLFGGFEYLARHRNLAILMVLVATTSACGWPFVPMLPALADRRLHLAEQGYSWLLSATGAGSLIGAVLVATYGSMERKRRFILGGVFSVVSGLLALSYAPNLVTAIVGCGLCGAGLILFLATCQSVFQLSTDDSSRNRVMAIYAIILSGAVPLGNQIVGHAADDYGVGHVLFGQALACAAFAAALLFLARLSRKWSTTAV